MGFLRNLTNGVLAKNAKTFTCNFPILGEMTAKGTSEDKCQNWKKTMSFLAWDDVAFTLEGELPSPADAEDMIEQYVQAKEHEAEIVDAIKADKYVKALATAGIDLIFCRQDDSPMTGVSARAVQDDEDWGTCINVSVDGEENSLLATIKGGRLVNLIITLTSSLETD